MHNSFLCGRIGRDDSLPMKDLTQGSIASHLVSMAMPTVAGMLLSTVYFFVHLYFVSGLGEVAVAGVSAAGSALLAVQALAEVLGIGTVVLMSHAAGRK